MNFIFDLISIFFTFSITSIFQEKIVKPIDGSKPFTNYLLHFLVMVYLGL